MKLFASVLLAFAIPFLPQPAVANDAEPVIQSVAEHLKQDLVNIMEYGAHQRVVTTKLSARGTPTRIEEKNLRTVWVHNKPKNELVHVTCNEMNASSGKSRRCPGVEKASFQKDSKPGKFESEIKKLRWAELQQNFNYTLLPQEGPYFVISFSPKAETSPKNRIEKVLSRMAGKVWVDRQFNLVKAEAKLVDTVSFGLGVAARIQHLEIHYGQEPYENVWLPSSLTVDFKAKVALVHTERRRIEVFWTSPYRRSDTVWAQAIPLSRVGGSSKR